MFAFLLFWKGLLKSINCVSIIDLWLIEVCNSAVFTLIQFRVFSFCGINLIHNSGGKKHILILKKVTHVLS